MATELELQAALVGRTIAGVAVKGPTDGELFGEEEEITLTLDDGSKLEVSYWTSEDGGVCIEHTPAPA